MSQINWKQWERVRLRKPEGADEAYLVGIAPSMDTKMIVHSSRVGGRTELKVYEGGLVHYFQPIQGKKN